jgi:hypothetical protein
VALARALVAGTGLILCDEPLSNLDADLREAGPSRAGPLRVPATAAVPGGGTGLLMIRPTGVALSYDPGGEQHLTGIVTGAGTGPAAAAGQSRPP